MTEPSAFDSYADDYEAALNRGLSLTGETRDYYAERRVEFIASYCRRLGLLTDSVCDFGCGTGDTLPLLHRALGAQRLIGLDPSARSLSTARTRHNLANVELATPAAFDSAASECNIVYCNGVFHHIPPSDRRAVARQILALLRPGGYWFFWENNPFNLGTRWLMSRIPFDRDAIMLVPREARRLGEEVGAIWVETTFHFYFPRLLRPLRKAERWFLRIPLGGQYLVVLRNPVTNGPR
ncbi:MAG TPA: class I SAM-dependent methyltransferase [Opitutus sp.]|nr:class I SAM-dependent methyltransferase [Opitutus sp.]